MILPLHRVSEKTIHFMRLAQRLSATALSRQQPVRPTERRTPLAEAHAASRALVYCEPLSEWNIAPPAT